MKDTLLPIARPPFTTLGREIESACRKAIYDFSLIEEEGKLAIALSGGKDSLALLFLLHAISGRGVQKFSLHAIHVDGEFSCGAGVNATFLEAICKELGVEFIRKESTQKREGLACYSCSRERRSLIFKTAKEIGATTVAFGHHRDDSIGTLMLNLLHKGEFAANLPKVPMIHYGVTIIRPLIYVKEIDIINFAKQQGFLRISCQCPVGQKSQRKDVSRLLTLIEESFPHVRANLATASLKYGSKKAETP